MQCPRCQHENAARMKFCGECGTPLTANPSGSPPPIPKGQGVASRAAASRQPVQVSDIAVEGSYESPIRGPLMRAGYRAILTVPLFLEERVIGALGVSRKTPGEFAASDQGGGEPPRP